MQLSGIVSPIPTPTAGATIDTDVIGPYVTFLEANGIDAIFPCGSIGEFPSLSRAQRRRTIEATCDAVDVPVLAGCGGTSVASVRGSIDDAADAGAAAAVVVTPYYLDTTQEGLHRFFDAVLKDAALPVVLYDIPARTGVRLSIDTIAALAERDGVIGLKDSTGDLTRIHDAVEATPESFAVLQGATELALGSLELGADGAVAGPANVVPRAMAACYAAHRDGEHPRAATIARRVATPIVSAITGVPTAAAMKHLVRRVGFDTGDPVPPLSRIDDADRERLDACYDRVRAAAADLDAVSETRASPSPG